MSGGMDEIAEHFAQPSLSGGVGGLVDDQLTPTHFATFAWTFGEAGRTVTALVERSYDEDVRELLSREGRVLALTMTNKASYRSVQLKGRVTDVRDATADEIALATRLREVIAEEAEQMGYPAGLIQAYIGLPTLAVTMTVEEVFDQTPGPAAGNAIEPSSDDAEAS